MSSGKRANSLWIWAAAATFYILTAAPTMGLGDVALLVDTIQQFHLSTHVNNHPMTVFFGAIFSLLPFSDIVYGLNLLSAVVGSLAVWVFYLAVREALQKELAALIATLVLLTSHSMWWHSTVLENYCFNALATTLFILFAVRLQNSDSCKHLYLLFFVSALALFNHVQMAFLSVGAGIALLRYISCHPKEGVQHFVVSSICYFVGLIPWLVLFAIDVSYSGDVLLTLRAAFFGSFEHIMLKGTWGHAARETGYLFFLQTPHLYLLFVLGGPLYLFRKWGLSAAAFALSTEFVLNTYFFMFYNTWDRFAFLLPSFIIAIFAGSFVVDRIVKRLRPLPRWYRRPVYLALLVLCALSPTLYGQLATWGEEKGSFWHPRYSNSYTANTHRGNEFIANPNKRTFDDVDSFLSLLFKILPPGAIYIDDDSRLFYPAQVYQKYYQLRPDVLVTMVNSWGIDGWGMNSEQLQRALLLAYYTDAQLFLVTLQYPFQGMLKGSNYEFERFSVDKNRWIYRLKTQAEAPRADVIEPRDYIKIAPLIPDDIAVKHRGFSHNVFFADQKMEGFEGEWEGGSQLFVRPVSKGTAFIELLTLSQASGVYEVELGVTTGPDYGKVQVKLGDEIVFRELDFYSKKVERLTVRSHAVQIRPGFQRLQIQSVGQSSKSSGTAFGIDTINLSPAS